MVRVALGLLEQNCDVQVVVSDLEKHRVVHCAAQMIVGLSEQNFVVQMVIGDLEAEHRAVHRELILMVVGLLEQHRAIYSV